MPLDPDIREVLDRIAASGAPELPALNPQQAREMYAAAPTAPRPEGVDVEDITIATARGPLPARVYRPPATGDVPPVVVFFHGSGWVLCSLDSHDATVATLTLASACVWVSVDYGLAPERKFPEGLEDCYAATRWVADNAASLGVRADKIALAGDSAGGNLAAVTSLLCHERGGPPIAFQLLAYPVIDLAMDRPSYTENAPYGLNADRMRWYAGHYLTSPDQAGDWRVAPIESPDLSASPPTYILAAEYDVLRDEDIAYAGALRQAGVDVTLHVEPGAHHGFWNLPIAKSAASLDRTGAIIGAVLREDATLSR